MAQHRRAPAPANNHGVSWFAAWALISAPASISRIAAARWPFWTASNSGVWPDALVVSTGVPAVIRRSMAAPSPRSAASSSGWAVAVMGIDIANSKAMSHRRMVLIQDLAGLELREPSSPFDPPNIALHGTQKFAKTKWPPLTTVLDR
jgi:hypothetical protein